MNTIDFASNLSFLRLERKLSVEQLAEQLGTSPETVFAWECASTSPTLDQMMRLSALYGLPLDELVRNPKPRPASDPPSSLSRPVPAPALEPAPEPAARPPEPTPNRAQPQKKIIFGVILSIILVIIFVILAILIFVPETMPFLYRAIHAPLAAMEDALHSFKI